MNNTPVPLFDLPDDIPEGELEGIFQFFDDSLEAGHAPHPKCETCAEFVRDYIDNVRKHPLL